MGLDPTRALTFALLMGAVLFGVVFATGELLRLGSLAAVLGLMAGGSAFFLVCTAPGRAIRVAAFRQTMEAPSFAAASNIYLKSTASRSKTLLMLRAEEPRLRALLTEARRSVLLGYDASAAIEGAVPEDHVFSESVKAVIGSVSGAERARVEEGSEELDAMLNSSGLDEETKLPLFIAVAFFLPIMLMLFAAVTKGTGPVAMGALVVLELVILDIALAVSSSGSHLGAGR